MARRGEPTMDPRLLVNQEKILRYLQALREDQHKLKQDVHMIMKENKHFQKNVYENTQRMTNDIATLQETVDEISNCAESINNKTRSVHKHIRSLSSRQNISNSDTDSSVVNRKKSHRSTARQNARKHGLLHPGNDNWDLNSSGSDRDVSFPTAFVTHPESVLNSFDEKNDSYRNKSPVIVLPTDGRTYVTKHYDNFPQKPSSADGKKSEKKTRMVPTETPSFHNSLHHEQPVNQPEKFSPVQLQDQPPQNLHKPDSRRFHPHTDQRHKKGSLPLNVEGLQKVRLPSSFIKPNMRKQDFEQLAFTLGLEPDQSSAKLLEKATFSRGTRKYQMGYHSIFILDMSSSVVEQSRESIQTFLNSILECMDISAEKFALEEFVSLVTFGKEVGVFQSFSNNYNTLMGVIKDNLGSVSGGRSPIVEALATALIYMECQGDAIDLRDQRFMPRVVIISDFHITNGRNLEAADIASGEEVRKTLQLACQLVKKMRDRKYQIYCIPVGDYNRTVCETITETGRGTKMELENHHEVGHYYRHQVVANSALYYYDQSQDRGEEEDIEEVIEKLLPTAELPPEDKETIMAMITDSLNNDADVGYNETDDLVDDLENDVNGAQAAARGGTDFEMPEPLNHGQTLESSSPSLSGSASSLRQNEAISTSESAMEDFQLLPEWRVPKGTSNFSLEEISRLPALGSRVIRGKDWQFQSQDGRGPGTVVCHKKEGIVLVLWDNNNETGTYRYGTEGGIYDVEVIRTHRHVDQGQIEIGCLVTRGPHWTKGDEDGGVGTIGVVIRKLPERHVKVRWPSRVIETYKFGADEIWEVKVTEAEAASTPGSGVQTPARTGSDTDLTHVDQERPAIPGEEEPQVIWRWKDRSQQWRLLSMEAINKLEHSYSKNPRGNVMIQHKGKNCKVYLMTMECEVNGAKTQIQREMMTQTEIQNLQEVEALMGD